MTQVDLMQRCIDVTRSRRITVDIIMRHLFTAQFFYGFEGSYYGYDEDNAYGYNEAITKQGRMTINVM